MKHKTWFMVNACRPTDHLCSGTEGLEENDLSVWHEWLAWWQIALTDEILAKIREEKNHVIHDRNV